MSYLDMMERHSAEERRRAREREIMEEGKALWMAKKNEELELEHRDQEQVKSRANLFKLVQTCSHLFKPVHI